MKLSSGLLALVACVPALAIQFTNSAFSVNAGEPFTLTWTDADGPVTINLKDGASTNLQTVETLASGLTGTSFTWTPPLSLASNTYALEIADSSSSNFSPQFTFQGSAVADATPAAPTPASPSSPGTPAVTATAASLPVMSLAPLSSSPLPANGSMPAASTPSRTGRPSGTTTSTSTNTPINTSDSQKLGSPLALVLGALMSLFIFN